MFGNSPAYKCVSDFAHFVLKREHRGWLAVGERTTVPQYTCLIKALSDESGISDSSDKAFALLCREVEA